MTRTVVHFLDSNAFGGTEQALLHLLANLDRRDWRPIVFHHAESGLAPFLEGAQRLDVETRIVPRMEGLRTVRGLPQFLQQLRAERPTVFHAHLSWVLSCKYGLLAAGIAQVPAVVATAQQLMDPPWGRTVPLQQRLFELCVDRYIAVSHAVSRQLCETFRVPPRKIRTIHNSIPFEPFGTSANPVLRSTLNRGTGLPIVLTVARLDQQKGHSNLLRAMCHVPNAILVLAGDGPERGTLETQARDLGIFERVMWLGHRSDIPQLLASCDVFVLPSVYEGLPLAVLEAMAVERAVVATSVGGIPEAVQDGETGLLVAAGDPSALARAIQMVLANPALASKMGAAGKARVKQEFSSVVMAHRTVETYEEILTRGGNTRGDDSE